MAFSGSDAIEIEDSTLKKVDVFAIVSLAFVRDVCIDVFDVETVLPHGRKDRAGQVVRITRTDVSVGKPRWKWCTLVRIVV